jgi:2-oxoglutarate ferredoxin oxidoreductase subunit gamma
MQDTMKSLYEEVIIAGFGGQGIILAGKLLAQAAMNAGYEVTFMQSYGAEVRGGTANCAVVISDKQIACPVVSRPDTLIAMNKASLNKFGKLIKPGGLVIMNSSLVDGHPELPEAVEIVAVPADDFAVELGNKKVANMAALGAYLQKRGQLSIESAVKALPQAISAIYHKTLPVNTQALYRGAEFAFGQTATKVDV